MAAMQVLIAFEWLLESDDFCDTFKYDSTFFHHCDSKAFKEFYEDRKYDFAKCNPHF